MSSHRRAVGAPREATTTLSSWVLTDLCRMVLWFRLLGLGLTAVMWLTRTPSGLEVALWLGMSTGAVWLVIDVHRRGLRGLTDGVLAVDALFGVSAATAVFGFELPFGYYVMSSCLLAGLISSGGFAAVVGGLTGITVLGVELVLGVGPGSLVIAQASLLSLFPLSAVVGALVRRLLNDRASAAAMVDSAAREGAEQERSRIALDLHDTVGKTLEGVLFTVAALDQRLPADHPARRLVTQLADDMRSATGQARMLMLELRNEPDGGVEGVVTAYTERWSSRTGTAATVDVRDTGPVPAGLAHDMLAMLTECLANVERHAAATRVTVSIHGEAEVVVIEVCDDGKGLPVANQRSVCEGHLGLEGLRSRARRRGGEVHVESSPRRGTTVRLTLPMGNVVTPIPVVFEETG